jgi:hypothetical protein
MGGIWLYQVRGRSAPDASPLQPVPSRSPVKEVFDKYKLLGTFAWDCSKPVSRSNLYYVNRLLDGDRVQREQMSGPTNRDFVIFIDGAWEVKPNEVAVSGMREGKRQEILWRIERNADGMRMRGVEASWDGKKLISGEKVTESGRETPWLNRCGD